MIWHLLKYLLAFSVPSFYRKIQIKNAHHLKNNHSIIICSNHPNAFMDPIAFSYMVYPPRIRYMARGDAFKPGIISCILKSIGIIPIFRIQDAGIKGVKKNNESYRIAHNLLAKNKKIMIFAEGICVQEKRLRPIKKGVPRLIFTAQQELPHKNILILPVCMNYSNPSEIGSTLFINIGEPFTVQDRMTAYSENPNSEMQKLMNELYQKMLPLTIHIENPVNDDLFEKARTILRDKLCVQKKLNPNNLEHIFIVEKELSDVINRASEVYPEKINLFSEKVNHLHSVITQYNIDIPTIQEYKTSTLILTLKILLLTLIFIPYTFMYKLFVSVMSLPYILSHKLAQKTIPSIEFYASFFLAFSTFIYLFYFMMLAFLLKNFISFFSILLFYTLVLSFIPLFHYYNIFRRQFITLLKILKSKTFALNLSKNLEQVLSDYEYLKTISFK